MMSNAINALEKEREITMVVIPEAVYSPDCANIQTMVLDHCSKMQNRFAILDVQAKSSENQTMMEQVKEFQTNIGNNGLSYGALWRVPHTPLVPFLQPRAVFVRKHGYHPALLRNRFSHH